VFVWFPRVRPFYNLSEVVMDGEVNCDSSFAGREERCTMMEVKATVAPILLKIFIRDMPVHSNTIECCSA
jgi:hypothetical protein